MQPFNAALFLFNGIAAQIWFLGINLFMSQFYYKIFRMVDYPLTLTDRGGGLLSPPL